MLELLTAIAIISILAGISLPALRAAREQARIAVCLSNAHNINAAMTLYLSEYDVLPWFYVHRADANGEPVAIYPGATEITSFSWGGFLPERSSGTFDSQVTPVELRPFNRYLAPAARGFQVVETYVCPTDDSNANPDIHSNTADPAIAHTPNWRTFGTSYSISWHWLKRYVEPDPDPRKLGSQLYRYGRRLVGEHRSAAASRLIWMAENQADQLFNAAAHPDGSGAAGLLDRGWHGRFSEHTVLFLDGHAVNHYIDTRFTSGADWTIVPAR